MARLERWISWSIAERPDPGQRQLLHRYAVWHVVRRLRGRLGGAHATHGQVLAAQRNIKAAIALLDWLTARDLTLATARQGDLEEWLADAQPTHRTDAGNFVRWARRHKLTRLDFAAIRWGGPSGAIDTEARWQQARWLLHDDRLKPEDRLAGLLVLLYAQRASAISRLTLGHVQAADGQVRIRLGREPIVLPEPLDALVLTLTATRRGHAAIGDQGTSTCCSLAASPASRSAPSSSPNACASSASAPASPAPPRCSSSPPTCPQPSWPACSASTSASRSPGSGPPPATGPPTPPRSAAGHASQTAPDRSRR